MLAGRVAFVTGAGGRIGRCICLAMAREGARVAAADLDLATAQATAEAVRAAGGEAVAVTGDVSVADDVTRMIEQAEAAMGPMDILVNDAGIFPTRLLLEVGVEEWDRVFAVNVRGTMLTCQAFGRRWVHDGVPGAIVNISSGAATSARIGGAHYCGSKAAVNMLTHALAIELGPYGIRVNAVAPGLVTDHAISAGTEDLHPYTGMMLQGTPLRRTGTGEDIAEAVVFLASDRSPWTTGAILEVSGGSHCGRPHVPLNPTQYAQTETSSSPGLTSGASERGT